MGAVTGVRRHVRLATVGMRWHALACVGMRWHYARRIDRFNRQQQGNNKATTQIQQGHN
jgi:hypothetical protein